MKTALLILIAVGSLSCRKEPLHESPFDKIECGTWHIANDGSNAARYIVAIDPVENVQGYEIVVTSDTIIKIYEREIYQVYYKDTSGTCLMIEHETGTGPNSYTDSLPCTIY